VILVDTHAHLDDARFEADLDHVISRALHAQVQAIITIGADLDSSRAAIALAEQYPQIYAAVGIHPHEAARVTDDDLKELARLSEHPKVVAIGEIGLDFYRNLSPRDSQRDVFTAQLRLAMDKGKPVVIHDRDAHAETLAILTELAQDWRGVLHCFSGGYEMAIEALELGFDLSFAGPVTFKNARNLHALVPRLPLERLLIETDCPWLAPHPHRGKRNEPAHVGLVAAKIAELHSVPLEHVAAITTTNAEQLFGLSRMV
jgi:TatD DNase family protein